MLVGNKNTNSAILPLDDPQAQVGCRTSLVDHQSQTAQFPRKKQKPATLPTAQGIKMWCAFLHEHTRCSVLLESYLFARHIIAQWKTNSRYAVKASDSSYQVKIIYSTSDIPNSPMTCSEEGTVQWLQSVCGVTLWSRVKLTTSWEQWLVCPCLMAAVGVRRHTKVSTKANHILGAVAGVSMSNGGCWCEASHNGLDQS